MKQIQFIAHKLNLMENLFALTYRNHAVMFILRKITA
jgi:hypothetical protein